MNDNDRWIYTTKSKLLILRFRVKGFDKQFYLTTNLRDSASNKNKIRALRDKIESDIFSGEFDSSLEKYKFNQPKIEPTNYTSLSDLWIKFCDFKGSQLEVTTMKTKYTSIARCIQKLPSTSLSEAPSIRDWLLGNTPIRTAWETLNYFSTCCDWGVESSLIPNNPFKGLLIPKPKKKSTDDDFRAFTLEQRDIIISAFENHSIYSHYASLVKFLFWTGCRPGEAFALTWGDVSRDCKQITINKSRNMYGILKGTKNNKKRIFPASPKLTELLLKIRADDTQPGDIVFLSRYKNRVTSHTFNKTWKGHKSKRYSHDGVVTELVRSHKIPFYLKPYAARHTFATWAVTSGVSPDKVALWIGDDVQTVLKFYVHPSVVDASCPDF